MAGGGRWSDLTWARPSNSRGEAVFTPNQTLPPHPLAARPGSINTGVIHFLYSLLQLDRWSMNVGTRESNSKWRKWENVLRLQSSLGFGDGLEQLQLTQKGLFPESKFTHSSQVSSGTCVLRPSLNFWRVLFRTDQVLSVLNFKRQISHVCAPSGKLLLPRRGGGSCQLGCQPQHLSRSQVSESVTLCFWLV